MRSRPPTPPTTPPTIAPVSDEEEEEGEGKRWMCVIAASVGKKQELGAARCDELRDRCAVSRACRTADGILPAVKLPLPLVAGACCQPRP